MIYITKLNYSQFAHVVHKILFYYNPSWSTDTFIATFVPSIKPVKPEILVL